MRIRRPRRSGRAVLAVVGALVGAVLTATAVTVPGAAANTPDFGLTGWDSYRRLDRLPYYQSGVRTLQSSSYDRTGGNDDGFDGTYSCLRTDASGCVLAEDSGPGEIDSIWFTRQELGAGGLEGDVSATGRIRIDVDGRRVVDRPLQEVVDGALGAPFTYPLVANADQSSGGVYIKVPMPYTSSMRVSVDSNPRFYHVTYRHFPSAAGVAAFDPADPAQDVVDLLARSGTADPKPAPASPVATARTLDLPVNGTLDAVRVTGPGKIDSLRVRVPDAAATDGVLSGLRLQISFDGRRTVDSPLGEFFGAGLGEASVRSLMTAVDPAPGGWYTAWWPMPYRTDAVVTLSNYSGRPVTGIEVQTVHDLDGQWSTALAPGGPAGYFHAISRSGDTTPGADWEFAATTGTGRFVGVSHTMIGSSGGGLTYLEGDERVYVDGATQPQIHGTGTEDFYEGGWYFNRGPFSRPTNGASAIRFGTPGCPFRCDSAYRLMLAEAVDYSTSLRFGIEHGQTNDLPARYGSTAFLYTGVYTPIYADSGEPRPSSGGTDFDRDPLRRDDIVTFTGGTAADVYVALSTGSTFGAGAKWDDFFAVGTEVPLTGDVDGDGYDDVITFTQNEAADVYVAKSDGSRFGAAEKWNDFFALPGEIPAVGDVNNDGKDDILTFTRGPGTDVYVGVSTGGSFAAGTKWQDSFALPGEIPAVGDVDRDGCDDIVSFTRGAAADVYVSLSNCVNGFEAATKWNDFFAVGAEVPAMGDVNGDGCDDIITFTRGDTADVYVGLSNCTNGFGNGTKWNDFFAVGTEIPGVGDFNGDGCDDIITYTRGETADVYVGLSNCLNGFYNGTKWNDFFAVGVETPRPSTG